MIQDLRKRMEVPTNKIQKSVIQSSIYKEASELNNK